MEPAGTAVPGAAVAPRKPGTDTGDRTARRPELWIAAHVPSSVLGAGMVVMPPVVAALTGRHILLVWSAHILLGGSVSLMLAMLVRARVRSTSLAGAVGALLGSWAERAVDGAFAVAFTAGQAAIAWFAATCLLTAANGALPRPGVDGAQPAFACGRCAPAASLGRRGTGAGLRGMGLARRTRGGFAHAACAVGTLARRWSVAGPRGVVLRRCWLGSSNRRCPRRRCRAEAHCRGRSLGSGSSGRRLPGAGHGPPAGRRSADGPGLGFHTATLGVRYCDDCRADLLLLHQRAHRRPDRRAAAPRRALPLRRRPHQGHHRGCRRRMLRLRLCGSGSGRCRPPPVAGAGCGRSDRLRPGSHRCRAPRRAATAVRRSLGTARARGHGAPHRAFPARWVSDGQRPHTPRFPSSPISEETSWAPPQLNLKSAVTAGTGQWCSTRGAAAACSIATAAAIWTSSLVPAP